MKKLCEVKNSGIHNKGVYATEDITKGTPIIEYRGEKISKEEGDKRLDATHEAHKADKNNAATYIFELNDEYDLDGDIPDNDAKYINHSCNPNCDFEIGEDSVLIHAKRDIKKGEELTYNYGFDFDDEYKEHPCKCGSENCVGFMIAEEDWPMLEEAKKKEKLKKE
ncbi:MAG: SET domain-containing protein [Candidatus Woesearchaeota archaeon]